MNTHQTLHIKNTFILAVLITILVCSISIPPIQTHAQETPKEVLILNSYHQGLSWSDSIVESVKSTLEAQINAEIHIEYMETRRINNDAYLEELLNLYKLRFQNRKFDIIISTDNNAFNFLRQHRDTLFPNTPVIFCGVNNYQDSMLDGIQGFTGVAEDIDIEDTVSVALSLHPNTEHIFIINDQTNTANVTQALIDQAFEPYQRKYEIKNIRQFTWQSLQDQVAQLPPDSLIFLFVASRDSEEVFLDYDEVAKLLENAANAPIYSIWDFYLEQGIVGGKLTSGSAQGEAAAKMAIQVLNGQPVKNIPVLEESPNLFLFDYHQLRKWQIHARFLPEDSIIVNNPYRNFLEKNLYWILVSGFGLLFLSLVIFILILAIRKRTESLLQSNINLQKEIEEKEKLAKELEAQQTFTTLALDNVHTSVISRDAFGKPQYFNNAFLKVYGIPDQDIPFGKWDSCYTLHTPINEREIPPEEYPQSLALKGTAIQNVEYILKTKNKNISYVLISCFPLRDPNGKIAGTICTTRDITHYKEAEIYFQQLVEASPIPIIIVSNIDQNIQFINQKFIEIFGYTIEEIPDTQTWMQKAFPDPEYRTHVLSVWGHNSGNNDDPRRVELQITCKDGTEKTIEGYMAKIGENLMVLYNDVSERKEMELALDEERGLLAQRVDQRTEELRIANADLSRAARMKDEFLASMSHELRTPLNAILGLSECLKEALCGPLTDKQFKYINIIEDSGRHLLELINDILDVSKIEAGELSIQPERISIESVCQSSIKFIQNRATKKHISIITNYDPEIQVLYADPRRIKQILVNLLSNAVKFTHDGGTIGLDIQKNLKDRTISFVIWDTGIGIAQEDFRKLFRPFVQLDSSLSRAYEGTGLGLALVYRLTQMHGGEVNVISEVGEGSRFTITLPIHEEMEDLSHSNLSREGDTSPEQIVHSMINYLEITHQETSSVSTEKQHPPQTSILLAEDNPANIQTISDYLQSCGYDMMVATTGIEALQKIEIQLPSLILMDIQMPEMNGLEAIKHIRKKTAYHHLPVIALTALAMPGDRERCLEAGADEYLSKPIKLKKLKEAIEKLLNEN